MSNRFLDAIERTKEPNRFEAAIARAREAKEQQAEPTTRGDIRDPLLQGLTFGLYDEAAGAVSGGLAALRGEDFNEAYNQRTQQLRGDYDAYRERNPRVALGAEIAGALPTAIIPGGAALRGATLASRVGRGMGVGAATGGFYGHNQGEGALSGDRIGRTVSGALTGGAVGGALPAVGAGAQRLYRALMDRVRPNAATQAGVNRSAQKEINRTLAADDMTVEDAAARLQEYGPDASLVDASDGLREAGRQMVQFGNPGHAPLAALGRERGRQAATRIGGAFETVLGKRPAPAELVDALKKRTQRNADANFGAARDAAADPDNIPYNPALQPALDAERQVMQRARVPDGDAPDGSFEFLSNAQRRISGKKRAAERARDSGGGASAYDDAAVLGADEGELVVALDNATEGKYSIARQRYADDKQLEEAFDYGFRKAMSPGTEISFLRKEWGNLSKPAKVAARAGVRAWLGQKAGSVRGGRAAAREVLREGDARDKLTVVFGEDITTRLSKAMEGQEAMWVTDDALQRATGSQTARNLTGRLNPENQRLPLDISMIGTGVRGVQKVANAINKPNSMTRSLGPALAARGSEREKLMQALLQASADRRRGYDGSKAIQSILRNTGGGAMVAPAAAMQPEDIPQIVVRPNRRR